MERIYERTTFTSAIAATASTVAVSSSELVDMKDFTEYLAIINQGVATTAGVITVTVWQSTSSTWAGAVATSLKTLTGSSQTASRFLTVSVLESEITDGRRYIGVHVAKADTASGIAATVARDGDRYIG
jgi:phosphoserine aminotransferase